LKNTALPEAPPSPEGREKVTEAVLMTGQNVTWSWPDFPLAVAVTVIVTHDMTDMPR
jgi:hypothetical protein